MLGENPKFIPNLLRVDFDLLDEFLCDGSFPTNLFPRTDNDPISVQAFERDLPVGGLCINFSDAGALKHVQLLLNPPFFTAFFGDVSNIGHGINSVRDR